MSNLQQNYDFNYQQPNNNQPDNSEDEKVRKIRIIWIVLVAIPVVLFQLGGVFVELIDIDAIISNITPEMDAIIGAVICGVPGSFIVAHHIIAIVGKIKYCNNKKMHDIFVADMIMLVALVIGIIAFIIIRAACDAYCGNCG